MYSGMMFIASFMKIQSSGSKVIRGRQTHSHDTIHLSFLIKYRMMAKLTVKGEDYLLIEVKNELLQSLKGGGDGGK